MTFAALPFFVFFVYFVLARKGGRQMLSGEAYECYMHDVLIADQRVDEESAKDL